MDGYSKDIVKEDIEKLKSIFPQCVVEGKVKIDQLLNILGEYEERDYEKYEFTWKGKNECYKVARERTKATLLPCESESVNFNDTENLYIEGDNLEVLKILQQGYYNKIKMIYIDPPYNTGNDFIYKDNYKDSLENYKKTVSSLGKSNPETSGRFHTDWLNMMFPRLMLAHTLLKDDGVIFISIDDNELNNLRKICDEVFGEDNFIGYLTWIKKKKGSHLSKTLKSITEYILVYAKNINKIELFGEKAYSDKLQPLVKKTNSNKSLFFNENIIETRLSDGNYKKGLYSDSLSAINFKNDFIVKNGKIITSLEVEGKFVWTQNKLQEELNLGSKILLSSKFGFNVWRADQDSKIKRPPTLLDNKLNIGTNEDAYIELSNLFNNEALLNYPKPTSLIKYLINTIGYFDKDFIILDFFSGSATTAHAVMQLNAEDGGNRKYIMVQLPELCGEKTEAYKNGYKNICEIGKERIRRAGAKIKEEMENTENLDIGFRVFKLDSTNFNKWNAPLTTEEDLQQFLNNTKTLVNGRTEVEAIFEILIKNGLSLTEKIYSVDIDNYKFYYINEDCLIMICFEENIPIEVIEKAIEYAPPKMVFSRKAFKDTSEMVTAKHIISKEFSYGQIEIEFL